MGVERDEAAVIELPERVDLSERHVVLEEEPRELREDRRDPRERSAVTPVEAIVSLAMKSLTGAIVEKWRRPTLSGLISATCSMSMPPTGEKIITGRFRR